MTRQALGAIVTLAAAILLCAGSVSHADDLNRPPWWDFSRIDNTYQVWEFFSDSRTPMPDGGSNAYGFLPATVAPNPSIDSPWISTFDSASGVWDLTGAGNLFVPVNDDPTARPLKRLWVQMTWRPYLSGNLPVLTATTSAGYTVGAATERMDDRLTLPNGWTHSTFELFITPSPASETLRIGGNIYLDELVVDTYSTVPEPASAALLLWGLIGLRRRKR